METHSVDDDEPNCKLNTKASSVVDTNLCNKSENSEYSLQKNDQLNLCDNSVIVIDDGILQKKDEMIYMGLKQGNVPRSRITDKEIENLIVKCTSCGEQINHHNSSHVRRHLHLGVLICRECFEFYDSGEFSQDETGDIYCRWCAQGGKLIACDFCLNAFCYNCVRRNFGRSEVSCIQDDVKWHCYLCNPVKLNGLVSYCSMILDYSQRMSRKKSTKLCDKNHCINDFSDTEKGSWMQQRIENVTGIAESLKEQVQSLKINLDKEKPDLIIQCNKVLDRILNKHIRQLRNVVENTRERKAPSLIKERNLLNSRKYVKAEEDLTKIDSSLTGKISKENGMENCCIESDSDCSEFSDDKDSKEEVNDADFSLEHNAFQSDSSDGNSDEEDTKKLNDSTIDKKNESAELSESFFNNNCELKSADSDLINKNKTAESKNDISIFIKNENDECKFTDNGENSLLIDENKNNILNTLNKNVFNTTKLISISENHKESRDDSKTHNYEMNTEISKNNDDEKENENNNNLNSNKKYSKNLTESLGDENDNDDIFNNKDNDQHGLSSQEIISNSLLLTESNSSSESENKSIDKKINNEAEQKKIKSENEKIKEKLLADDSSDSETEPFSLPEIISTNKEHFNSDSTTEVSTTQSDSDSNTSEESKSDYSDHKDDKLQMDVKIQVEKVDDRTLDDTIEDLPMDEQKSEKCDKSAGRKNKNEIRTLDNDIDKEIDRLAELSTLQMKKKKNLTVNDDSELEDMNEEVDMKIDDDDENPNKNETAKQQIKKIKSKEIISSDSDFDSDNQLLEKTTKNFEQEKSKLNNLTKSQNEVAKELLLKDTPSSSNDDTDKSSETSDSTDIFKKRESEDNINEHDSDEDFKPDVKRNEFDSDDSVDEFLAKKIKRTYHKLLAIPLSEDDSRNSKTSEIEGKRKQIKRKLMSSDDEIKKRKGSTSESDSDASTSEKKSQVRSYNKQMKKRRRIKQMSQSSDDDSDDDVQIISENQEQGETPVGKGRKNIRKLISDKKLRDETKAAAQAELERKKRILERQKAYNHTVVEVTETGERVTKKLVLEIDEESKEELIQVHPSLIVKLKPHQVEGVKFMWEGTIESLKQLISSSGSGCILAHCMGLGKTLQVIVFTHTLLTNEHTKKAIKTCLVICPYNTILNWAQEYESWLDEEELKLNVFELASVKDNYRRASCLEEWKEKGGVMIMSYDMFRLLVQENSKRIPKKLKSIFTYTLLDPGPDLVICDEGHILKNESSAISKATVRIKTRRRVVLTGTPLQNNLSEYHCMVQFVKPHLLGTRKEFLNRFVNPISNGQCADSTPHDVKLMKKRVHILHKLLEGCVQRCDYNSLTSVLPPRHEYVISLKLSDVQVKLYKHFLENLARVRGGTLGSQLFRDCCILQLICTHPYTLQIDHIRKSNRRFMVDSSDSETGGSFIDDRSLSEIEAEDVVCLDDPKPSTSKQREKSSNSSEDNSGNEDNGKSLKLKNRDDKKERREWWSNYIKEEDGTKIDLSGKMVLFFDLLKECELIGDKVLLFSQNLLTLDLIEDLLASITQNTMENPNVIVEDVSGSWIHGIDYFRMDGSTNADLRKRWIEIFNDEENTRARLFMISKKAGGLGTNLIGANRVIIMDASWNPSHDIQAIFRVYRFGQKKPVYIYRLLAQGTMEEKIYDRQVTKQSLSCRVVDEQQIERHFNSADLAELYMFNPDSKSKRPTPMVPKDRLLAEMLIKNKDWIVNYHEHDSLLQNISEEDLTEEERQAAWVEYEAEREGIVQNSNTASWNVLDPIIQHQPVPTPDQNPETYGPLPDARVDIAKVVENLKLRRPNMAPNEMNSALLSALVMLRAHYQQCHVIAVRQKQDYMARNETAPVQLNEYLSALNVSIQQLTQVLQTIRAQQSQIHQAQQAAAGIRFRTPPWNQNNRMNHLNRANQTQAYKITLTRGTPPQGQPPNIGVNQNILSQGPRRPTTINIQLLSNNQLPVITTANQRLPVNNVPYASSVLRGHAIRLAGNNILLNNNNRTTFRFNTPGNINVPRFNVGNGVTITPISTPQQSQQPNHSQYNHPFPQETTQEPVITEVEDAENLAPKIRPQNSHTSSVTITEVE